MHPIDYAIIAVLLLALYLLAPAVHDLVNKLLAKIFHHKAPPAPPAAPAK